VILPVLPVFFLNIREIKEYLQVVRTKGRKQFIL